MTALATICALLPMAFALTGGGAFISQPLAIVVIGGLLRTFDVLPVGDLPRLPPVESVVTSAPRRRSASSIVDIGRT